MASRRVFVVIVVRRRSMRNSSVMVRSRGGVIMQGASSSTLLDFSAMAQPGLDLPALRRIAARYGDAKLVVVFGSLARGEARQDSDADVAVLGVEFWPAHRLGAELGAALEREAHVVELETASDQLRFEIARDGVLVHEAEHGTWARFQAEAALRWFDLAPIVARCAAGVRARLLREAARG